MCQLNVTLLIDEHNDTLRCAAFQPAPAFPGRSARRRDRERVRRAGRRCPAGSTGLSGHRAGEAGCAGRQGLCVPAGRLHLRRRADHRYGTLPAGGALATLRSAAADDVELRPVSPYYRIRFDDGEVFEYSGDPDAMRAEVARVAPSDVAGYEAFLKASEARFRIGFERLGHVPFNGWTDMARVLPDLVRLAGHRSVYDFVCRHVRDERLRVVLSFHPLLVGGNPFATTSIYSLIAFLERRWGVHFAMGGTGSLVRGLVGLIEGQGGAVRCGAEITRILVTDKRAVGVRLASGEEIAADV